jgi:hypothetical protein
MFGISFESNVLFNVCLAKLLIPFTFCLLNPQLFNWVTVNLQTVLALILFLHFFLNLENTELAAAYTNLLTDNTFT